MHMGAECGFCGNAVRAHAERFTGGDNLPFLHAYIVHAAVRRGQAVIVRQCHAGAVQTVLGNLLYSAVGQCEHGFAGFGREVCAGMNTPVTHGRLEQQRVTRKRRQHGSGHRPHIHRCADRHRRFRRCRRDRLFLDH